MNASGSAQSARDTVPGVTTRERIGLVILSVDRARKRAVARLRRARILHWRERASAAEELLIAPPDLRGHDETFIDEIESGKLGLGGWVADLDGLSPFAVTPPGREWARELHGFGWLRHLDGTRSRNAERLARTLVRAWIRTSRRRQPHAWTPEITGRRVIAWLSHAGLLLDGADRRSYTAVMRSLGGQAAYLQDCWSQAADGYPRLLALVALVFANLCIANRDRELAEAEQLLVAEVERQILPEGGHISRNPWIAVELLLDLLPLRQCFAARGTKLHPSLLAAISQMLSVLRYLRLGDGLLARFNGMGATEHEALATVLAYDQGHALPDLEPQAGYMRLQRGSTIVLVDVDTPPPLDLAYAAGAGCLSFELSTGSEVLLANGGAPAPAQADMRAAARATASHNTLCLGERSSSKLIRNARLERHLGAPPIRHPDHVTCEVKAPEGGIEIETSHDGYVEAWGIVHARTLKLRADGLKLEGIDKLLAAKGVVRFSWDVAFAIHFHLHPDAEARLGDAPEAIALLLPSGAHWRLSVTGATVSIEPSIHFADAIGARQAQQVVLRGVCYGAAEVVWTLEQIKAGRPVTRSGARHHTSVKSSLGERLAETSAAFETAATTAGRNR